MSYQVHNFQTGEVIEAPPINEMDAQILKNSQDIGEKADKVSSVSSAGNFAGLDSNGNLTDSGHKHSDYLVTSAIDDTAGAGDTDKVWSADKTASEIPDISGKADKDNPVFTGSISRGRKANTTSGTASVALGDNVEASGLSSQAFGRNTTASGAYSHAEGYNGTGEVRGALGQADHAEGSGTLANSGGGTAYGAHAEGNATKATNGGAHAEGVSTTASGSGAHAEGSWTTASGRYAHAEGNTTTASGDNSHSEGTSTQATGDNSHAEGWSSRATGKYAHAEGTYTIANHKAQHTGGEYNVSDPSLAAETERGDFIEIIGNGTSLLRSNARALDWNGNERLAGDVYVGCNADSTGGNKLAKISEIPDVSTKADKADPVFTGTISRGRKANTTAGTASVALGNNVEASGLSSQAFGRNTTASGAYSHAEGYNGTGMAKGALGQADHVEGSGTLANSGANGYGAHAEGNATSATNSGAHAEGQTTTASGSGSHAEGSWTTASGRYAHAEGNTTTASGSEAHSEGASTQATGDASHAEGWLSRATGKYSHAEGIYTIANHKSQHTGGEYNVEDPSEEAGTARGDYIEIIGNGTNLLRSNARALDWDGNERLAGDLYVGCNSDSTGGTKVAKVTDVPVIDDTAGGGDTDNVWSADKTTTELATKANAINTEDTTAAQIKTLSDGADGMPMGLTVGIEPVQNLHGYSAPWPDGTGKNKLPTMVAQTTSLTTTVNSDGSVLVNGTNGSSAVVAALSPEVEVTAGVEYILSGCPASGGNNNYRIDIRNTTGNQLDSELQNIIDSGSGVTFTPSTTHSVRFAIRIAGSATVSNKTFYPMLRLSSITDATYASYSNICPISGFDAANVMVTGENLFDGEMESGQIKADTGANATGTTKIRSVNYIPVKLNAIYTLSRSNTSSYVNFRCYDANKAYLGTSDANYFTLISGNIKVQPMKSGDASCTFKFTENVAYLRFQDDITDLSATYMLEIGSTATAYEPYTGNTYEITFPTPPGTVYGGTLTVNKDGGGKLVVNTKRKALSTLTWTDNGNFANTFNGAGFTDRKTGINGTDGVAQCDTYKFYTSATVGSQTSGIALANSSSATTIYVKDTRFQNASAFTSALAQNEIYVVCPLATPVSYDLNASQIRSLLGINNIWADCGDIKAVEYSADTKTYINNIFNSLINATGVIF